MSCENATPPSGTSPLASYMEVPPPPHPDMDTFNEIKIGFSSIKIAGIFRVNPSWLLKR